ncbi:MAG: MurR/RpiR family transcriptional regulator [Vagococcus sp.]
MSIIEHIQEMFPKFSEKERDIGLYLLQHTEKIKNINISELARLTDTSPATITRFAKKVDCTSFVDLKIKLNMVSTEQDEVPTDQENNVYHFYTKVIENTRKMTDSDEIEQVVELIKNKQRILVIGAGSSGLTAIELTNRLIRMGLNASAITDPHLMIISSSIANEKDLVIALSNSGETVEVVNAIELAKNHGSTIVSVTSFSNSSIAKLSDYNLITYNTKFVDDRKFINSQFAIMYLIDILSTLLLEDETFNKNMNQTIDVILKNIKEK